MQMDFKIPKFYLHDIGDWVLEEDQIVTYKLLSRKLGVHVNKAKQLLYIYFSSQMSDNKFQVSATYLLAGRLMDGSFTVTIATDTDFKSVRSKFVHITSEHLYSVQKSKRVKDIRTLVGSTKGLENAEGSNLIIHCSSSLIKSNQDKKGCVTFNEENNKNNEIREEVVIEENKKNLRVALEPQDHIEKNQRNPKRPNIGNYFANSGEKSKNGNFLKIEPKEIVFINEERNKSKDHVGKEGVKQNKRKRIHIYSDSESDCDNDEKPSFREDDGVPATSTFIDNLDDINKIDLMNKRKKRKVVDKTVMNEDGYLETKKEVVFETDSENDCDEKSSPEKVKKQNSVLHKEREIRGTQSAKKQASLLSFLKKN